MRQPRKLGHLTGYSLEARDGEIGKLEQVYFDDQHWLTRYFVVRTGGWLFGRQVLVPPAVVSAVDQDKEVMVVELTREQIRNSPPVDSQLPVSRHYEEEFHRYYGWEPYWTGEMVPGTVPTPRSGGEGLREPSQSHLRSSDEVRNYHIQACDGEIGHVEDFVLEEPDWDIGYLEVDTRNWLPGKHVLVAPAWIREVDWASREVRVDLDREAIRTAPPYDPSLVISRDYEVALFAHYGRQFEEQ